MVDTTMADEVDTLMTIRGSLQTTDGIELVLEAGKLAELYNQASTRLMWTSPSRWRRPRGPETPALGDFQRKGAEKPG